MSKHEMAILSRVYAGPLPMTFSEQADIEALKVLHGIGLVQAVFDAHAHGVRDHGTAGTAVVKRVLIDSK